jgi:hypothetical protein
LRLGNELFDPLLLIFQHRSDGLRHIFFVAPGAELHVYRHPLD